MKNHRIFEEKAEKIARAFQSARERAPQFHRIPSLDPNDAHEGILAGWFEGATLSGGQKTRVFGYYSVPNEASPENPVPGVVLVHGGGGHAFLNWVKMWNDRGYAAIALDFTGFFPTQRNAGIKGEPEGNWKRELPADIAEDGYTVAPTNDEMSSSDGPVEDMWMYHAVTQAILSSNILRADSRVRADQIGISGVSWGGVITSLTIGYDDRFAFAIPIYGSAYLDESLAWMGEIFSDEATQKLWLAQDRLDRVHFPVLWQCWNDDTCFSINSNGKSYLKAYPNNRDSRLSVVHNMGHSHRRAWVREEPLIFADSVIKGTQKIPQINVNVNGRDVEAFAEKCPTDASVSFKLYYMTEPMSYKRYNKKGIGVDTYLEQDWQIEALPVADGVAKGRIPAEAAAFYVELEVELGKSSCVVTSPYTPV